MQDTRTAPATACAGVMLTLVLALLPAPPAAAHLTGAGAAADILIPEAGWHGRAIRAPHRHAATVRTSARAPRGWEAGPAGPGTGTHRASGSQRVREVQWRLRALGYRPGPIDGIFGVRTRAAVAWFQVKHGLRVDGRATFAVVRHLRDRTEPSRARPRAEGRAEEITPRADDGVRAGPAPGRGPGEHAETGAGPEQPADTEPATDPADDDRPWWSLPALLLLAFGVGFAAVALVQARRRRGPVEPLTHGPRALGYVRVGVEQRATLDEHARTIEQRCADRGIALTELVTDDIADERPGGDRPGLALALERLRTGEADCLVVGRVGHLTRSPAELAALLDTMPETPLVVLNAGPGPGPRRGRWASARMRTADAREVRDG